MKFIILFLLLLLLGCSQFVGYRLEDSLSSVFILEDGTPATIRCRRSIEDYTDEDIAHSEYSVLRLNSNGTIIDAIPFHCDTLSNWDHINRRPQIISQYGNCLLIKILSSSWTYYYDEYFVLDVITEDVVYFNSRDFDYMTPTVLLNDSIVLGDRYSVIEQFNIKTKSQSTLYDDTTKLMYDHHGVKDYLYTFTVDNNELSVFRKVLTDINKVDTFRIANLIADISQEIEEMVVISEQYLFGRKSIIEDDVVDSLYLFRINDISNTLTFKAALPYWTIGVNAIDGTFWGQAPEDAGISEETKSDFVLYQCDSSSLLTPWNLLNISN